MNEKIRNMKGQLQIMKSIGIKPNFSELERALGINRHTIKKYYNGYEGKPAVRNKPSKLDKYYEEIKSKINLCGVNQMAVYQYLFQKDNTIGTYSNFKKYIAKKNLNVILCLQTEYEKIMQTAELTSEQIEKRKFFSYSILNHSNFIKDLNLSQIIFSDESRFCLNNDNQFIWFRKNENTDDVFQKKSKVNQGVMVFGAIGYNFKSPLIICENSIDEIEYREILSKCSLFE